MSDPRTSRKSPSSPALPMPPILPVDKTRSLVEAVVRDDMDVGSTLFLVLLSGFHSA